MNTLYLIAILGILFGLRYNQISSPDGFHGESELSATKSQYFEGWYFKVVENTPEQANEIAVIGGVFLAPNHVIQETRTNSTAFIMVVFNGVSHYYKYPVSSFRSSSTALNFSYLF